jgi:aspartyl-tRNA synthetase
VQQKVYCFNFAQKFIAMFRTHNCGELRIEDKGLEVLISGWVDITRDLGGMTFVDLRDRYGITQVVFNLEIDESLCKQARTLGREYVVKVKGIVEERSNKNPHRATGDIEIRATSLEILNLSKTPPFTIEEHTDGGDDLRMKYRYLDLRRPPLQKNILFRSQISLEVRKYLSEQGFLEIETPFLIKSTPEGARDFVVPSRLNEGQFYALPQSPQTFKQILMVAGYDKYFQIVRCFRDEDLRADRQPEFTQIDCEMSFVTQEDILNTFEGLTQHLFQNTLGIDLGKFPRMSYDEAMRLYGSDKPDLRIGMIFHDLTSLTKGYAFPVFEEAEIVLGIKIDQQADNFSNKDIKDLTEWVQRPQIGAKGLVHVKYLPDGSIKSSVGKFYEDNILKDWLNHCDAQPGDMLLMLSGPKEKTQKQLGELRLEMGRRLNLFQKGDFKPLWVVDFPLLEWDEETQRFYAMHHPFTSPKKEDIPKMHAQDTKILSNLRADAYDLVINGAEIGGGSIRIHDRSLQSKNFDLLGFSQQEAEAQFGFLLGAFEYGAPPHGGIAFGLDRLCAVMNGQSSIRDFIAFPKNNQGRDTMIDAPATLEEAQLKDLNLQSISDKKQSQ